MSNDIRFQRLLELYRNNPEKLEQLRREEVEKVIQQAPEKSRQRLRGLQFKIDMEIRKAKTPLASCIKISQMMHESLHRLDSALKQFHSTGIEEIIHPEEEKSKPAAVIKFTPREKSV